MEFTTDQKKVIEIRNHNVLVSAAAGSGKTAVLVERILGLIIDAEHPVDIDRLLVVTFTNAAAAEMRERIHKAILERLEKDPLDANLQRQSVLINHANITTIDSFCRFILMNHFQDIDLDPGFSVGDPGKMKLMQKQALEKVMECAYACKTNKAEKDVFYSGFYNEFIALVNAFSVKGQDRTIADMVEQIFQFIMSQPYPEKWMLQTLADYEITDVIELENTVFMQDLYNELIYELRAMRDYYELMIKLCESANGPEAYLATLTNEREFFERGIACSSYDALYTAFQNLDFQRLPTVKKGACDTEVKDLVQALRNEVKKRAKNLQDKFLYESGEDLVADMNKTAYLLRPLLYLTKAFMQQFAEDKRKDNVIDFADMEHFALQILVAEDGTPTETAKWYQSHFETVMIDEYQDSNDVQELLLSVVSREYGESPNRFMVGDMKQSIYRFRMARPEIFMGKYNAYGDDTETEFANCTRIDLKRNFRSRSNVLDLVNHVFRPLMHSEVGGIEYDEAAALYLGANYPDDTSGEDVFKPELLLFELKDDEGEKAEMKAAEGEAVMIANRIKMLMAKEQVTDKESGKLRPVRYEDIVILVRSIGTLTDKLQEVLKREGIPTSIPSKTGYFSATEIRVLLQYIEVCSNPYRDIPLAAVLKSPLYGFSDEELARIALEKCETDDKLAFYEKLKRSQNPKAVAFLEELQEMRSLAKTETVHDFLYCLIRKHRYQDYVGALPAGGSRRENIEMLLQQAKTYEMNQMHGLFGFLQYMKQLEKYEIDYGSGSEDSVNSVQLMTIHKSKGLEFPICFVSGLAKQFNRRDLSGSLLLHTDLGIGMEYRDYSMRLTRPTIKQRWIAKQQLIDSMGEELRVLYVALTRAKEKCILTGTVNDFGAMLGDCSMLVQDELQKDVSRRRIDGSLITGSTSYLKLLTYVIAIYGDHYELLPDIHIYHEDDLKLEEIQKALEDRMKKAIFLDLVKATSDEKCKDLREKIQAEYPHKELQGLYTKTSVSEIKHAALHEDDQTKVTFETDLPKQCIPNFLKEERQALGTTRGTAYHRFMELLDFTEVLKVLEEDRLETKESTEKLKEHLITQKNHMVSSGFISSADAQLVDLEKICKFFMSPLAREMMVASGDGLLYKEQPFVMEIPAKRVDDKFPEEETMLIQGIIDAFYEQDGNIYLMDYKTDRVNEKKDLVERYQIQLEYYKEAIERTTGKTVAGVYIYSFFFNDVIKLDI